MGLGSQEGHIHVEGVHELGQGHCRLGKGLIMLGQAHCRLRHGRVMLGQGTGPSHLTWADRSCHIKLE